MHVERIGPEQVLLKLEWYVCTLFILYARKTGARVERVSTNDKTFVTWTAHYEHGCIVQEVATVKPEAKKTCVAKKAGEPEEVTALQIP